MKEIKRRVERKERMGEEEIERKLDGGRKITKKINFLF